MAAPALIGRPRYLRRLSRHPPPALWLGTGLAAAGFAVVAMLVAPGEIGEPPLPPELAAEPDVYIEDGRITQHDDDGAVRYRLRAGRITHFHQQDDVAGTTRIERLEFEFPHADAPWRGRADGGDAINAPGQEERLRLAGNVELLQQRGRNGFTRLRTDALTLLPEQRVATTDQPVTILTESSRMSAAGAVADLASGRMRLFSSGEERVRVVARQTAGEREGLAPRMQEPSAGEREGLAPRKKEPSAGEREGLAPRKEEPSRAL